MSRRAPRPFVVHSRGPEKENSMDIPTERKLYDSASAYYRGADILAGCTDSAVPVIEAEWLEPGTHVLNVGGGSGIASSAAMGRVDLYFRFGNAL